MKIERKRFVVMRKNRTEIWGGCARNFSFRPIDNIGEFAIKTYRTENQALSSCSSWDRDFEVVPITETISDRSEGEWERRVFIIFDSEKVGYRCSECNTTWDTKTHYCPNCGEKMKGGE